MRYDKYSTNILAYLFIATFCAYGQANTNSWSKIDWSRMNAKERYYSMRYTTLAYQKEALNLIVAEANQVAQELNLPEKLPIVQTNLLEAYISPPHLAQGSKALGNITTSNYTYYVSVGNKFSFLVRTRLEEDENQARSKYQWPISQIDTNAAYQLATQFLKAASMDVDALNTNCDLHVKTSLPEGVNSKNFVPLYWITWSEKNKGRGGASVELCLPTKTILQMRVNKSEYILRQPLQITNLDYLLSQTNSPMNAAPQNRLIH
jgi:hypothetical protein